MLVNIYIIRLVNIISCDLYDLVMNKEHLPPSSPAH